MIQADDGARPGEEGRPQLTTADDLADRIGRIVEHLSTVNRHARAGQAEEWATLDLTMAQFKILFILANEGRSPISRLAGALGVTLPTVTGTVDRLVRHGLVERQSDPTDRRIVIAQLTGEGRQLIERLQQGKRNRLTRALEQLSPDELAALDRGLAALARQMGDGG